MAYCFIATTTQKADWQKLHAEVFNPDSAIEMFPISSDEPDVLYLGINIPFSKLKLYPDTWDVLVKLINNLKTVYSFEVFDLYNGFFVDDNNINKVKEYLLSK